MAVVSLTLPLFPELSPDATRDAPEGFAYRPDLLAPDQEACLIRHFQALPFREFAFHGFTGRRRVCYFGYRYDFGQSAVRDAEPMPDFLLEARALAASFSGLQPEALVQAMISEYRPGAGIGWHRDRPVFEDIIGVSFASACRFRFRCEVDGAWVRRSVMLAARSAYLLRGPARTVWQHSIAPGESLRYSVTFRSMARGNVHLSRTRERSAR
jgi:alkylated DNA repair dioxygenase AlkB